MTQTWKEIQRMIQKRNFIVAEKKAVAAIKKSPFDFQLWAVLAEALRAQKYYRDAYHLLHRVRVTDPMAAWVHPRIQQLEALLPRSKPKKYDIHEIIGLSPVSVTAAMVINDDVENAGKWVERTREAVDWMVVVDTGSPPATLEYLSKQPNLTLIQSQWRDSFAAARNVAIPYIESNWVIWIDSDEFLTEKDSTLDSIRFIASLYEKAEQKPVLKVTHLHQKNSEIIKSYDVSRMYSTREDILFFGRVHEQIRRENQGSHLPRVNTGIEFEHTGYDKEVMKNKNKLERNRRLLEMSIEEEPWNPLWWTFLGRETLLMGEDEQALSYLKTAEEKANETPNFGRLLETFDHMMAIYKARNDLTNMGGTAEKMLAVNKNYPNARYMLSMLKMKEALYLMQNGEGKQRAFQMMREVLREVEEIKMTCTLYRGSVTPDQSIANYKADLLQADVLRLIGKIVKAKVVYEKVYKKYPHPNIQKQLQEIQKQVGQIRS